MTKRENEILYRLEEKFNSFLDSHTSFRENIEKEFGAIHSKIDQGQSDDKLSFERISIEIWDDEKGIRTRVKSLENTRSNVKTAFAWLVGSGTLIGGWIAKGQDFLTWVANHIKPH